MVDLGGDIKLRNNCTSVKQRGEGGSGSRTENENVSDTAASQVFQGSAS